MFFYLSKLLFLDFLRIEGNLYNFIYREIAPLNFKLDAFDFLYTIRLSRILKYSRLFEILTKGSILLIFKYFSTQKRLKKLEKSKHKK